MHGIRGNLSRGLRGAASRQPAATPFEEFLRYGAVSAVALAADFTTLVLLTELLGIHYLASAAIGFTLGILIAYLLSIRWVFPVRRLNNMPAESAIFFLIGLAGLLINHMAMFELTEAAHLPYALSKVGAAGLVFAFNYTLRKVLLFRVAMAPKG